MDECLRYRSHQRRRGHDGRLRQVFLHRLKLQFVEQNRGRDHGCVGDKIPRSHQREGHRRQTVLQAQQIARGLLAHQIGPGGECLAKLYRRRTDSLKCSGIVGQFWLHRTKPRIAQQSAHWI